MKKALMASVCWGAALAGLIAPRVQAANAPHVHNTAAEIAAQVAPEPFRSHWKACRGGSFPDQMRDQPLGHANQRAAGLLLTMEAIRTLRQGQINKALLLASIRAHYVADSSCIAHALVWSPRRPDDRLQPGRPGLGVWSFLPAGVQDYRLPFADQAGKGGYRPLLVEAPPLFRKAWDSLPQRELTGSMHAYFDQTHPLGPYPKGFPATGIADTTNWSAYDREYYGRWVAENIALTVLDRKSVLSGRRPIRFVDAEDLQKALEADLRNMAASTTSASTTAPSPTPRSPPWRGRGSSKGQANSPCCCLPPPSGGGIEALAQARACFSRASRSGPSGVYAFTSRVRPSRLRPDATVARAASSPWHPTSGRGRSISPPALVARGLISLTNNVPFLSPQTATTRDPTPIPLDTPRRPCRIGPGE
ncbi:MAG TPA: hypothetical protein VFJ30_01160 [Phycisphaerae bacterium]|nr:hypothetical protein [Phycisphaerae bacterium]